MINTWLASAQLRRRALGKKRLYGLLLVSCITSSNNCQLVAEFFFIFILLLRVFSLPAGTLGAPYREYFVIHSTSPQRGTGAILGKQVS